MLQAFGYRSGLSLTRKMETDHVQAGRRACLNVVCLRFHILHPTPRYTTRLTTPINPA